MRPHEIGRRGEQMVARAYQDAGARVRRSPGSRGAADLVARFSDRIEYVQVKTGANGRTPAWPKGRELGALKGRATRTAGRATAVVAQVDLRRGNIRRRSARTGRDLSPLR